MLRTRAGSLPSYRHHKARNLAVVTIDSHDHYLGPFGSPSGKEKYEALIRAWRERQERTGCIPCSRAARQAHPLLHKHSVT